MTSKKVKVMYLDDMPDRMLVFALDEAGFDVAVVKSYQDAIKRIQSESFDLYVLDFVLTSRTEDTGEDVAHEIRRLGHTSPIVIHTGTPQWVENPPEGVSVVKKDVDQFEFVDELKLIAA